MTTLETALIVVCAVIAVAVTVLVFLRVYIIKSVHKPQDIQYTSSMNTEILYGQSNVQLSMCPPLLIPNGNCDKGFNLFIKLLRVLFKMVFIHEAMKKQK